MPTNVLYPKVSLERPTGRIARWMVAEGDSVRQGQILFEIEDDKAAVEVEAPADGVIRQMTAADAEVEVGEAVALILGPGENPPSHGPHGTHPNHGERRELDPVPRSAPPSGRRARGPNPTPLARRLAAEHSLDLTAIVGTGPRGRIQKSDIVAQLQRPAGDIASRPGLAGPLPPEARPSDVLNAVWLRQGRGIPLVLLHGFSGDLNNWRGLFAGVRSDWPVLGLDLPGHGGSTRNIPRDFEALAAIVEATLAREVEGPAVLVGHSLGAAVAVRVAARGFADIRALTLFAPAGLSPEMNARFVDGILRAREAASLKPWLLELAANPAVISEPLLQATLESRRDPSLIEAMRDFAARFLPDGTPSFSITADLAQLTIPTRVVFGRADRILPFAATRNLPGNVGLHAIDNCGHMPHLEHPQLCFRVLAELVRSL
ncbi:acetoin dehydrogenase dihydrolipoyllysine-residue acetyltransferase subunit [Dongia sedimenti]|uniref:Acetoin dehydrogenase dihydrolipoyllysine-residue acetyltransferase subunit n=1 Tax=Dongia sedimenti TaxID=3064282 RepID=A0ABU0YPX7_9PROT|nr:acetoin dehydrogenase dihydrolipoyllysine-residue acetyltransferase subunit [Rhodospirillaceae bacterium R-7]